MYRLPPEVVWSIVKHCDDKETWLNIRGISRRFKNCIDEQLCYKLMMFGAGDIDVECEILSPHGTEFAKLSILKPHEEEVDDIQKKIAFLSRFKCKELGLYRSRDLEILGNIALDHLQRAVFCHFSEDDTTPILKRLPSGIESVDFRMGLHRSKSAKLFQRLLSPAPKLLQVKLSSSEDLMHLLPLMAENYATSLRLKINLRSNGEFSQAIDKLFQTWLKSDKPHKNTICIEGANVVCAERLSPLRHFPSAKLELSHAALTHSSKRELYLGISHSVFLMDVPNETTVRIVSSCTLAVKEYRGNRKFVVCVGKAKSLSIGERSQIAFLMLTEDLLPHFSFSHFHISPASRNVRRITQVPEDSLFEVTFSNKEQKAEHLKIGVLSYSTFTSIAVTIWLKIVVVIRLLLGYR
ncbi:hypothetical protein QR680_008870 [Steinernema hermaphroditum]|uniref:F-box domain-containing protein n=1 Tax=Steinernema hermaphroditum TaxID=289476 RepID=A0AA39M8V4_9BILA|nr:hypothetical protein QR680_008870 [Steinernema hermaphroditum]